MSSFLDPRFRSTVPDDEGCVTPFVVGTVRCLPVVFKGGAVAGVPILLRFLRRRKKPTECVVCDESYFDVNTGTAGAWAAVRGVGRGGGGSGSSGGGAHEVADFDEDWMWRLLHFPAGDLVGCSHDFDTCKACLAKHIASHLEQLGRAAVQQISCPTIGCGRTLTYEEVRRLASKESFEA
jgi:hypothetical protein